MYHVKLLWHNIYCIRRYRNKGDLTWVNNPNTEALSSVQALFEQLWVIKNHKLFLPHNLQRDLFTGEPVPPAGFVVLDSLWNVSSLSLAGAQISFWFRCCSEVANRWRTLIVYHVNKRNVKRSEWLLCCECIPAHKQRQTHSCRSDLKGKERVSCSVGNALQYTALWVNGAPCHTRS